MFRVYPPSQKNFCFVPAVSALDIQGSKDLLKGYKAENSLPDSKFDNFYTEPKYNEVHTNFNSGNSNWIIREMDDANTLKSLVYKNKCAIKGSRFVCSSGTSYYISGLPKASSLRWETSSNIKILSSSNTGITIQPKDLTNNSYSANNTWIKVSANGVILKKDVRLLKDPTIHFEDTSLKDAIIAGISPDNYPDLPLASGSRIPLDIQNAEEIIWKNTREKIYIPKDKPGTHTYYDPSSLIRYVPYFACSPIEENLIKKGFIAPESEGNLGREEFTASKSVEQPTKSINYYFIEDFYRHPPTPEERPDLPNGLDYPVPDYEIQSPHVLDHLSPKIYFSDKGLIVVEVTASNQCACATETNIYNTKEQMQTSTPKPKESPYSLAMFPNPADNNVFISVVESVKNRGERIEKDPGRIVSPDLKDEFNPRQPIGEKMHTQNKYTIEVYNALSGTKIEQKYVYDDALSNLTNKIGFTSLNTTGYREGIYLIKVISETENTLITGKLSVKH